jgi:Spy/CpxP family protein refolding chaperone
MMEQLSFKNHFGINLSFTLNTFIMKQLLLFMFALVSFSLYAQSQETDSRKERKRIKTEQKQMKTLELNDNQGQQIKDINSRYRDAHKEIMQNDALTQEQKQERIQALNKKRVSDIHMIVGPDKANQFDRIHQNNKTKNQAKQENKNRVKENKMKVKNEKKSRKE